MVKTIVHGVKRADDVKLAAEAGADAVAFVVESKGAPGNVDITEAVESARLAPPFCSILLSSTTLEEARLRRAIGSLHPHAVEIGIDLDPMILADLQVSFPEVKWFARVEPAEYEPYHDAADALVLGGAIPDIAKIMEITRSRVILADSHARGSFVADVQALKPFAARVNFGPQTVDTLRALKGDAR